MRCVGIDYSINSPAVCIHDSNIEFSFNTCKFIFVPQKKSQYFRNNQFDYIELPEPIKSDRDIDRISRYVILCDRIMSFLKKDDDILIENFSYSSKGSSITGMAENCSTLKTAIYRSGMVYDTIAPKTLKKFANGNGNSKKEDLYISFVEETSVDLKEIFDCTKTKNPKPVDDIVDSYYLCKYVHNKKRGS